MKIAPNLLNLRIDDGIELSYQYTNTHFIFDPWISDTREEGEEEDKELQQDLKLEDTRERIRKDIEMELVLKLINDGD